MFCYSPILLCPGSTTCLCTAQATAATNVPLRHAVADRWEKVLVGRPAPVASGPLCWREECTTVSWPLSHILRYFVAGGGQGKVGRGNTGWGKVDRRAEAAAKSPLLNLEDWHRSYAGAGPSSQCSLSPRRLLAAALASQDIALTVSAPLYHKALAEHRIGPLVTPVYHAGFLP